MFESYRKKIEQALSTAIEDLGEPSRLRDACQYALLSGGKRLRPILVLLIGEALNKNRNCSAIALSVEYFHTASLIADDLPCMDNDDFRRNRPSLHKVFGESVAILASYTLIAAGYGAIYEASRRLKLEEPEKASEIDSNAVLCLEAVTRCAGLRGATHGQFLDLFPPDQSFATLCTIIERKTATLFEISFVLGWLFGGGDRDLLDDVRRSAMHLGMAFQIADDLDDLSQDKKSENLNFAGLLGIEKARALFDEEMGGFEECLKGLGLWNQPFEKIVRSLQSQVLVS